MQVHPVNLQIRAQGCETIQKRNSQQQNALGYNLSMQGIGDVAIDGPRLEDFLGLARILLRSRKWGSRKDFAVGLHSWVNLVEENTMMPEETPSIQWVMEEDRPLRFLKSESVVDWMMVLACESSTRNCVRSTFSSVVSLGAMTLRSKRAKPTMATTSFRGTVETI